MSNCGVSRVCRCGSRCLVVLAALFGVAFSVHVDPGVRADQVSPRKFSVMSEKEGRDWNSARDVCHSVNMSLATLDTHAFFFLLAKTDLTKPRFDKYANKSFWVGLYNENTRRQTSSLMGEYRWQDGCQSLVTSFWEAGQPKDPSSSFCVVSDSTTLHWRTSPCSTKHQFICQRREDACHYNMTVPNCSLYIRAAHRHTVQGSLADCRQRCEQIMLQSTLCWGFTMTHTGCVLHFQAAQPDCEVVHYNSDAYFRTCFQIFYVEGPFDYIPPHKGDPNIPIVPACDQATVPHYAIKEPSSAMHVETTTAMPSTSASVTTDTELETTREATTELLPQTSVTATTTLESTETAPYPTPPSPVNISAATPICPCKCDVKPRDMPTALREAAWTKKKLTLNKKTLSSCRRKVVSAPDVRTTSQKLAYVGMAFVTLVVVVILLPDVITVFSHIRHGVPLQERRPRRRVCPIID